MWDRPTWGAGFHYILRKCSGFLTPCHNSLVMLQPHDTNTHTHKLSSLQKDNPLNEDYSWILECKHSLYSRNCCDCEYVISFGAAHSSTNYYCQLRSIIVKAVMTIRTAAILRIGDGLIFPSVMPPKTKHLTCDMRPSTLAWSFRGEYRTTPR